MQQAADLPVRFIPQRIRLFSALHCSLWTTPVGKSKEREGRDVNAGYFNSCWYSWISTLHCSTEDWEASQSPEFAELKKSLLYLMHPLHAGQQCKERKACFYKPESMNISIRLYPAEQASSSSTYFSYVLSGGNFDVSFLYMFPKLWHSLSCENILS